MTFSNEGFRLQIVAGQLNIHICFFSARVKGVGEVVELLCDKTGKSPTTRTYTIGSSSAKKVDYFNK